MNSKTALTCSGWPSSMVSSVTRGSPTGLMPSSRTALLKRSGSRPSITSLRIPSAKRRRMTDSGTLPARKPGILAYFCSCRSPSDRPWRPLRREYPAPVRGYTPGSEPGHAGDRGLRGRDHRDRGLSSWAVVRRLGLVRLWIVFDCAGRTQRFAFHALCAPNKMPEWGINCLFWAAKQRSRPQTADDSADLQP